MNKYEAFFWWLDGYLSVTNDVEPILEKMTELKDEDEKTRIKEGWCICGYGCDGDDCR